MISVTLLNAKRHKYTDIRHLIDYMVNLFIEIFYYKKDYTLFIHQINTIK